MKKNKALFILSIMIGILAVIGISYAIWQLNFTQTNSNVISSACFDITLTDQDDINLQRAYPITDAEGRTLTPYTFTIRNRCSEYASYQVNLEVLNTSTLDSAYVKSEFNNTIQLVGAYSTTSKTLNNATTAYKLTTGYLNPNQTVTYTLRLWIDENSTAEQSANKIYESKVTVVSTYKGSAPTELEECVATYGEGASICNIIASADPNNDKCLSVDENGMILNPTSTMSDAETPIICTMEDDYGTSYYLRGNHQDNNVKFANMCWKLIRITGTGGYKLIYNGDLDENGKCTTTSGNHTGFEGQTLSLSGNKVYGTSYTLSGTTYTLNNTSTLDWTNDSASIIGKYTCGNTSTSCANPYYVVSSENSTTAYVLKMGVSTNYAQIGSSAFNPSSHSPSYVGYMYNDVYPYEFKDLSSDSNNYYYGSSFTYDENNARPYTLTDTVQISDMSNSTNKTLLNTHHYTCFYATNNTCDTLYYIYSLSGTYLYYIELQGNEAGPDALNKMVGNDNINVKNSLIKSAIDWWYEQNIKNTVYESKLEDTVFCNDRTINQLNGWSETGNVSSSLYSLQFNAYNNKYYLKCPNKRDAFTVSDTEKGNGALTYPVGLLTTAESSLLGNYTVQRTGTSYWSSAPYYFDRNSGIERLVGSNGSWLGAGGGGFGVRPSISLRPGTSFETGGDGTAANPYVVKMN